MTDLRPTFDYYFPEGSQGGQCAAFAEKLIEFGPVGNSFTSKLNYVKKYGSTVIKDIEVGDVVLTDDSKKNGHIFVVNCDMGSTWRVTESNFTLDEKIHHTRQVPKNSPRLKGHIRAPLLVTIINPASMNILLLKYKIPNEQFFQATIDYATTWFKTITGGQFVPSVGFEDVSKHPFTAVPTQNSQGIAINWIPPQQVVDAAGNTQAKILCLCADYDEIQPRPTYDEASGNIGEIGFLKTDQMQFVSIKAAFLIHEWLHIFYTLLNQAGIGLVDDVHQHSTDLNEPRPEANFSDIVNNKLKPYWSLLASPAQGVNMPQIKTQAKGPSRRIVLEAADLNEWAVLCKVYGANPNTPQENVKDA